MHGNEGRPTLVMFVPPPRVACLLLEYKLKSSRTNLLGVGAVRVLALEMQWDSSAVSRSCGPIAEMVTTFIAARSSTSSRTLDSVSWRKQVCEVRPNRSSTLGRFSTAQSDADHKTVTATNIASSTSSTTTEDCLPRPRVPRPPVRSSSDCCRCRALRTSSPINADREGPCPDQFRLKMLDDALDGGWTAGIPPPLPPPTCAVTSSKFPSTAASLRPTSSTDKDFCVHVEEVASFRAGSGSCRLHPDVTYHSVDPAGLRSTAADGTARCCLEDISEVDETVSVDLPGTPKVAVTQHQPQPVTAVDPRRLATGCTVTTFV